MKRVTSFRRAIAPGLAVLAVVGGAVWPGASASGGSGFSQRQAGSESTATFATLSGGQDGGTRVLVSDHGNVIGFESPFGYDHLSGGTQLEGYMLCYEHPSLPEPARRYDLADSEIGFDPPTSASSTATTASIVRSTSDGLLELKQDFTLKAVDKRLLVQLTVKNISGADVRNLRVWRIADFDIDVADSHGWNVFENHFARTTRDGVSAWNDPSEAPAGRDAHGMTLRPLNGSVRGTVVARVAVTLPCDAASVATPAYGDHVGAVHVDVATLRPGRSTTVKLDYLRT